MEPTIEEEDLDQDREGFTPEAFKFIKKNNDLSVITNIANASLFSIRNQCQIYSSQQKYLTPFNKTETFVSLAKMRDPSGEVVPDPNPGSAEVEIILNDDFYGKVLKDMGLKRYVDIPEEAAKLEQMLIAIGALASKKIDGKEIKVILLEVLIAAMRVYKYEYSGIALKTTIRGIDFRTLDAKSIRTMNRLTRQAAVFQGQYQEKANEGVKVTIPQIVAAMFKGQIEKKKIARPAAGPAAPLDDSASVGTAGAHSKLSRAPHEGEIQLIRTQNFYATLQKLKIRKTNKEHPNLSNFLKMNEQSKDLILFKKLVKVVEEFLKSHYLKSYGLKKNKLLNAQGNEEADAYGEEYG